MPNSPEQEPQNINHKVKEAFDKEAEASAESGESVNGSETGSQSLNQGHSLSESAQAKEALKKVRQELSSSKEDPNSSKESGDDAVERFLDTILPIDEGLDGFDSFDEYWNTISSRDSFLDPEDPDQYFWRRGKTKDTSNIWYKENKETGNTTNSGEYERKVKAMMREAYQSRISEQNEDAKEGFEEGKANDSQEISSPNSKRHYPSDKYPPEHWPEESGGSGSTGINSEYVVSEDLREGAENLLTPDQISSALKPLFLEIFAKQYQRRQVESSGNNQRKSELQSEIKSLLHQVNETVAPEDRTTADWALLFVASNKNYPDLRKKAFNALSKQNVEASQYFNSLYLPLHEQAKARVERDEIKQDLNTENLTEDEEREINQALDFIDKKLNDPSISEEDKAGLRHDKKSILNNPKRAARKLMEAGSENTNANVKSAENTAAEPEKSSEAELGEKPESEDDLLNPVTVRQNIEKTQKETEEEQSKEEPAPAPVGDEFIEPETEPEAASSEESMSGEEEVEAKPETSASTSEEALLQKRQKKVDQWNKVMKEWRQLRKENPGSDEEKRASNRARALLADVRMIDQQLGEGSPEDAQSLDQLTKSSNNSRKEKVNLREINRPVSEESSEQLGEVEEKIEEMSPEEREKLSLTIWNVGHKSEEMKAKTLRYVYKKAGHLLTSTNESGEVNESQGSLKRWFDSLYEQYDRKVKSSREAMLEQENAEDKSGWEKVKSQAKDKFQLSSNVLKGAGMFISPRRWLMIAGLATSSGAEAAKEARFKNIDFIEETRIKDAEEAANIAWDLYAQAKERGEGEVSADNIRQAYVESIPKNILEKMYTNSRIKDIEKAQEEAIKMNENLKDLSDESSIVRLKAKFTQMFDDFKPGSGTTFLGKVYEKQVERLAKKLKNEFDYIDSDESLTPQEKEQRKNEYLAKWGRSKAIQDYDKMITDMGKVDVLAASAYNTEKGAKAVVAAAMADALYKIVDNASSVFDVFDSQDPDTSVVEEVSGERGIKGSLSLEDQAGAGSATDSTETAADTAAAQEGVVTDSTSAQTDTSAAADTLAASPDTTGTPADSPETAPDSSVASADSTNLAAQADSSQIETPSADSTTNQNAPDTTAVPADSPQMNPDSSTVSADTTGMDTPADTSQVEVSPADSTAPDVEASADSTGAQADLSEVTTDSLAADQDSTLVDSDSLRTSADSSRSDAPADTSRFEAESDSSANTPPPPPDASQTQGIPADTSGVETSTADSSDTETSPADSSGAQSTSENVSNRQVTPVFEPSEPELDDTEPVDLDQELPIEGSIESQETIGTQTIEVDESGEGITQSLAQYIEDEHGVSHEKAIDIVTALYEKGEANGGTNEMFELVHRGNTYDIDFGELTAEDLQNRSVNELTEEITFNNETITGEGAAREFPESTRPDSDPQSNDFDRGEIGEASSAESLSSTSAESSGGGSAGIIVKDIPTVEFENEEQFRSRVMELINDPLNHDNKAILQDGENFYGIAPLQTDINGEVHEGSKVARRMLNEYFEHNGIDGGDDGYFAYENMRVHSSDGSWSVITVSKDELENLDQLTGDVPDGYSNYPLDRLEVEAVDVAEFDDETNVREGLSEGSRTVDPADVKELGKDAAVDGTDDLVGKGTEASEGAEVPGQAEPAREASESSGPTELPQEPEGSPSPPPGHESVTVIDPKLSELAAKNGLSSEYFNKQAEADLKNAMELFLKESQDGQVDNSFIAQSVAVTYEGNIPQMADIRQTIQSILDQQHLLTSLDEMQEHNPDKYKALQAVYRGSYNFIQNSNEILDSSEKATLDTLYEYLLEEDPGDWEPGAGAAVETGNDDDGNLVDWTAEKAQQAEETSDTVKDTVGNARLTADNVRDAFDELRKK